MGISREGGLPHLATMIKPNVNDLIPYMPTAVLREFVAHGGDIWGIQAPSVKRWLQKSTHPFVEAWCDYVRRYVDWVYTAALKRQRIMNDAAPEFYGNGNSRVRTVGVHDPVLRAFNPKCFEDQEAINDTKKQEPKLFIK